jgi:hypothetical protein
MDENQPIDESEYVYRRIHRQFYDIVHQPS